MAISYEWKQGNTRRLTPRTHAPSAGGVHQDAVCRILGGNDKVTCRAIAERFEEKYDQSLVDALKDELRGERSRSNFVFFAVFFFTLP